MAADDRTYFVQCMDGCLFESMTKEQILTAIQQAVNDGTVSDIDSGFVTKIKEQNKNHALKFWLGTQAEYNAIATKATDCFYIISDDDTESAIETRVEELEDTVEDLNKPIDISNDISFSDRSTITAKAFKSGNIVMIDIKDSETSYNTYHGILNGYSVLTPAVVFKETNSSLKVTPDGNGNTLIEAYRINDGSGMFIIE